MKRLKALFSHQQASDFNSAPEMRLVLLPEEVNEGEAGIAPSEAGTEELSLVEGDYEQQSLLLSFRLLFSQIFQRCFRPIRAKSTALVDLSAGLTAMERGEVAELEAEEGRIALLSEFGKRLAVTFGFTEDELQTAQISIEALHRLMKRSVSGYIRRLFSLDMLIEKSLLFWFLNEDGIAFEIKHQRKCVRIIRYFSSRAWPYARSLVFTDRDIVRRAVGVSNYFEGTLLFTGKIWTAALLSLLANDVYNYFAYPHQRYGNTLLKIFLGQSENQLTLTASLTQPYVWSLLLALPLGWGLTRALIGSYRVKQLDEERFQALIEGLQNYHPGIMQDLVRWFLPLHQLQKYIGMAEQLLLWDGRLPSKEREELFGTLLNLHNHAKMWTYVRTSRALSNLADGVATQDFRRFRELGLDEETIFSVLRIKTEAFLALEASSKFTSEEKKNILTKIGEVISRWYAKYLLWCIGRPNVRWGQLGFWLITLAEVYVRLRLFYTIFEGIRKIIADYIAKRDCKAPEKVWRYMTQVAEYQCTVCGDFTVFYKDMNSPIGCLDGFLRKEQHISEIKRLFERIDFTGIETIDFSHQLITQDFVQTLFPIMVQKAKDLKNLAMNSSSPLANLNSATARVLAQYLNKLPIQILSLSGQQLDNAGLAELSPGLANTKLEILTLRDNNIQGNGTLPLGEVLRDVPVETLDLGENILGDVGVQALAPFLPQSQIKRLYLDGNEIGDAGMEALGNVLPRSNLTLLSVKDNEIGVAGSYALSQSLPNSTVTSLVLSENKIGNTGAAFLSIALPRSSIRELKLDDNQIGDGGLYLLAQALPQSLVERVSFANNFEGLASVQVLAEGLLRKKLKGLGLGGNGSWIALLLHVVALNVWSKSEILDLSHGNIEDIGVRLIAPMLPSSNIRILNLGDNNISDAGLRALVPYLKDTKITSLNLGYNIGDKGFQALVPYLRDTKITSLSLCCSISDTGLQFLALYLKDTKITSLDLSGWNIGDKGLQALVPYLKDTKITSLTLGYNIGDKGLQALAPYLKDTKITSLTLGYNIGDKGLQSLAPYLKDTKITSLNLGNNNIGDKGLQSLVPYLKDTKITSLSLGTSITDAGLKSLAPYLKDTQITSLILGINIGDTGLQALAPYLKDTKITSLNLCCAIGNKGLQALVPYLKDTKITSLSLGQLISNVGNAGLQALALYLKDTKITSLNLGNDISDTDLQALAPYLKDTKITSLSLCCSITDAGLQFLVPYLKDSPIAILNLSYNRISNRGARIIAKVLSVSSIEKLYLYNNPILISGLLALSNRLFNPTLNQVIQLGITYCKTLSSLNFNAGLIQFLRRKKATQVYSLNLQWFFDNAGVFALSKYLKILNLTALTLSTNINDASINDAGLQTLVHYLKDTKITSLNLGGDITDIGLQFLAPYLKDTKITSLTLGWNIRDTGLQTLAPYLKNTNITSLNLGEFITNKGLQFLAFYLKDTKITSLNLGNSISDTGLQALAPYLKDTKITSLNLSWNSISDKGLQALAPYLKDTKITSLNLSWHNNITDAGLQALTPYLKDTKITSLSLGTSITDAGLKFLAPYLKDTKITSLSLGTSITDAGLKFLAPYLKDTKITSLSLGINIGDTGLQTLVPYLKNTKITSLDLGEFITNKGLQFLALYLKDTKITSLNLSGYEISDTGLQTLAPYLKDTKITSLTLGYKIGDKGLQALAPYLKDTKIISLDLSGNKITDVGLQSLSKVLGETHITQLIIDNNQGISEVMALKIAGAIPIPPAANITLNFGLRVLPAQPMGTQGIEAIAERLSESTLEDLSMTFGKVDSYGVARLGKALPGSPVKSLDLSGNVLNVTAIQALAPVLPRSNISHINLDFTLLGNTAVPALVSGFEGSPVKTVSFRACHISSVGFSALTRALPRSKVTSANLQFNQIGDAGMQDFASLSATTRMPLQTLDISANNIGDAGMRALGNILPRTDIQSLDMSYNFIGNNGTVTLAAELVRVRMQRHELWLQKLNRDQRRALARANPNTHLTSLNLAYNEMGNQGAKAICRVLPETHIPMASLDLEANPDITQVDIHTCSASSRLEPPFHRFFKSAYETVTGLFTNADREACEDVFQALVPQGYFNTQGVPQDVPPSDLNLTAKIVFGTDNPCVYLFMRLVNSASEYASSWFTTYSESTAVSTNVELQKHFETETETFHVDVPDIVPTIMLGIALSSTIKKGIQSLWHWWTDPKPEYISSEIFESETKEAEQFIDQLHQELRQAKIEVKRNLQLSKKEKAGQLYELKMLKHALKAHAYSLEDLQSAGKVTQEELVELQLDIAEVDKELNIWWKEYQTLGSLQMFYPTDMLSPAYTDTENTTLFLSAHRQALTHMSPQQLPPATTEPALLPQSQCRAPIAVM